MAKVDRLGFTPFAPLFRGRAEPRVRGTCPSPSPSADQASPGPLPCEEPGQAGFCSQTSSILYWPMAASELGPWTSYSWTGWLICRGLARWGLRKHRETSLTGFRKQRQAGQPAGLSQSMELCCREVINNSRQGLEAQPGGSHKRCFSRRHHRPWPTGGRRALGSAHLTTRPGLAAAASKVWLKHRGHKRHWRRKSQGEQSAELVCGSQLASLFV